MSSSCILANLLVTGGTGQIGSFLCDELVNRENTVLCYDTRASADILRSPTGRIRTFVLDITCLRLAGAWGPGRYSGYTGQFNDFIRRVAVDESARIPEDFAYTGAKLRWLYVKDVGRCFAHAAESSRPKGYLYNTGSERPFNASEVVRILRSLFPAAEIELTRRDEPTELSRTVAGPNGLD